MNGTYHSSLPFTSHSILIKHNHHHFDNHDHDHHRYANENVRVVLVGTKIDRADERRVREEEVLTLAHEWRMTLVETSAKTGEGVGELFNMVADQVMGGYRYVAGMGVANYVPDASEMARAIPTLAAAAAAAATTSGGGQAGKSNKDKDERCCVQ